MTYLLDQKTCTNYVFVGLTGPVTGFVILLDLQDIWVYVSNWNSILIFIYLLTYIVVFCSLFVFWQLYFLNWHIYLYSKFFNLFSTSHIIFIYIILNLIRNILSKPTKTPTNQNEQNNSKTITIGLKQCPKLIIVQN